MKKLNYILLFIFSSLALSSCLVDDEAPEDAFGAGPNLVSFTSPDAGFAAIADGEEWQKSIPVEVVGPTKRTLDKEITATISVDPASTAEEGVHYRLESNTVTLSPDEDFTANLPVVMLTDGIATPIEEAPVLILNIDQVSGADNIEKNGRLSSIEVGFNYLCPHDIEGSYRVENSYCSETPSGEPAVHTIEITLNDDLTWHLPTADGGFLQYCTRNSSLQNSGDIFVVCGKVLPTKNLDYGSLGIGVILGGSWDEVNKVLTLEHDETYFGAGKYTSTYTKIE